MTALRLASSRARSPLEPISTDNDGEETFLRLRPEKGVSLAIGTKITLIGAPERKAAGNAGLNQAKPVPLEKLGISRR
jgi:hypothetical protein